MTFIPCDKLHDLLLSQLLRSLLIPSPTPPSSPSNNMSNPHNNTPNRPSGTNDDWHGSDVGYPPGMLWEGTVFPSGRDERIWGPQDPLDIIGRKTHPPLTATPLTNHLPAPGPFDDEHGAEAWRLANRHVWTGEARVLGPRPSEREQWYRNEYWAWHDARRARAGVSRGREQELVGYQDFQDALPVHPGVVNPSLTGNAPARTITAPPPATHAPVVSHETHTGTPSPLHP